ncbi:MAG: hypothetical protein ABIA66_02685 [Candidatus Omnitrophota bacterium]
MQEKKFPQFKKNKMLKRFPFGWIFAILIVYLMISSLNMSITGVPKEIAYSDFYNILVNNPQEIKTVSKTETLLQGEFTDNSKFFLNIPDNDQELLSLMRKNLKHFEVKPPRTLWANLFYSLGPIVLLMFFWWMMASRG